MLQDLESLESEGLSAADSGFVLFLSDWLWFLGLALELRDWADLDE